MVHLTIAGQIDLVIHRSEVLRELDINWNLNRYTAGVSAGRFKSLSDSSNGNVEEGGLI